MNIQVAVTVNISEPLTYKWTQDSEPEIGTRVLVPLGNRVVGGWIINFDSTYEGRVRKVIGVVEDNWKPSEEYISFVEAVSSYSFISAGSLMDYSLSPGRKSISSLRFWVEGSKKKLSDFSTKQLSALATKNPLKLFYNKPEDLDFKDFKTSGGGYSYFTLLGYNLHEKYREIAEKDKSKGKNTLIVVPDRYTGEYLKDKLGEGDLYLSSLKVKDRGLIWKNYSEGGTGILMGGLSALMLPARNTGTIIFHRTGSYQYYGNSFTDFNLYQLAILKATAYKASFIEGGIIDSLVSASQEKREVKDNRGEKRVDINLNIVKPGETALPPVVKEIIRDSFIKGKKTAVIMNKKRGSGYLFCKSCKKALRCKICGGGLKIESQPYGFSVNCENCDFTEDKLVDCNCGKSLIYVDKPGIDSLARDIRREITDSNFTIFTAQEQKSGNWNEDTGIVLGTPAIITPHFNDTFDSVIIIRPENYVDLDSYDGAERLHSLVNEVKEIVTEEGKIEVFSVFHFHYALQYLSEEKSFMERDKGYREIFKLPPYCKVFQLSLKSSSLRTLGQEMREICNILPAGSVSSSRLVNRKKSRSFFTGTMKIHTSSEVIRGSDICNRKNLSVKLISG